MDLASSSPQTVPFRSPFEALAGLDPATTAHVLAATGDVSLIVDADGIIVDAAVGNAEMSASGFDRLINRRWIDTVSIESRSKIDEMMADAAAKAPARWRQVNHEIEGGEVPVRYLAFRAGDEGRIIAIGRDMRAMSVLQQRLLLAQQSMERDYIRLRQAESRYRLLFDLSSEAVIIVDAATRRITEANPAALKLVHAREGTLVGQPFTSITAKEDREPALTLLGAIAAADEAPAQTIRLIGADRDITVSGTIFRQDRGSYILLRLRTATADSAAPALIELLDRMPEPFVLTDTAMEIVAENAAFLDLVQCPRREDLAGVPLARYLGRPGIDFGVLTAQVREHGLVRNFATIARGAFGSEDDVEVSAVAGKDGERECFGFTIRPMGRRVADLPTPGRDLPRSVEQLTELVGRVSLKDIVRESTDLVERLCIEAALVYTSDNRASAAELLGLSRQSLYSKLHRHGLGNLVGDAE